MTPKDNIYATTPEPILFQCISNGDEEAFAYVYHKYAPVIYAFSLGYLKNKSDAEDAVQHVFLKLWERRGNMVITQSIRDYLFAAVKNYALNAMRNQLSVKLKQEEMMQRGGEVAESAEDVIIRGERTEQLELATLSLPLVKQRIISLRREGFSNKEISEKLNMPENTVKTYYAQCVRYLREHFKKLVVFVISFLLSQVS